MRRRLYFLLPDIAITRTIVDELLLARIDEHHIHVLARDDIPLTDLPEASLLQKSDLIHGMESGLIVGGASGAVVGAIATLFPISGFLGAGGLVLACAVGGAMVGVWASGMIATDVRNSRLRSFENALDSGQILLMVDAPKERLEVIQGLVENHHETHLEGTEPTIPAFP